MIKQNLYGNVYIEVDEEFKTDTFHVLSGDITIIGNGTAQFNTDCGLIALRIAIYEHCL